MSVKIDNAGNNQAGVAQLVEQLICNQPVGGSSPFSGFFNRLKAWHIPIFAPEKGICRINGGVPEWPKGTDCKSVGSAFGGSNPPLPTILRIGCRSMAGRAIDGAT